MLSRYDLEAGGVEREGRAMTVNKPGEKERLMLEPSSATSNSIEGLKAALDLVLESHFLELRAYWLIRWQGGLLTLVECLAWCAVDPGEGTGDNDWALGLTLGLALCGECP